MENLTKDIARKVDSWGKHLAERKGARDQLVRNLER